MSDPFRQRIENLLREGKISPEEASKLFKALEGQGETASHDTPTVGQHNSGPSIPPTAPQTPSAPPKPVSPQAGPPQAGPSTTKTETVETHATHKFVFDGPLERVIVNVNAGDIDVVGEGNHFEVESTSVLNIVREDNDKTIRVGATGKLENPTELGFLDTVFKAIGRAMPVKLKVKVPSTLPKLEVKALAGDVDVSGVRGFVTLDLSAGDLKLRDASGFNIQAKAGDVKVNTKLEDGESRLAALAGDVKVNLEAGSSVTLKASTTAGNVSAKGFILTATDKHITGGTLEGRLGAGKAKLEVSLTAGDMDVTAIDGLKQ